MCATGAPIHPLLSKTVWTASSPSASGDGGASDDVIVASPNGHNADSSALASRGRAVTQLGAGSNRLRTVVVSKRDPNLIDLGSLHGGAPEARDDRGPPAEQFPSDVPKGGPKTRVAPLSVLHTLVVHRACQKFRLQAVHSLPQRTRLSPAAFSRRADDVQKSANRPGDCNGTRPGDFWAAADIGRTMRPNLDLGPHKRLVVVPEFRPPPGSRVTRRDLATRAD